MNVRAFWCLSQNFGDMLTYALIERITGAPPQWVGASDQRRHIVGVGSILNHASPTSVVWGAGIARMEDTIDHRADFRLVRGPISAARVKMCGGRTVRTLGDPALLCPMFFSPSEKRHDLGFIPHYIDQAHWSAPAGTKQINVLDSVERVIAEITSCRAIVSSSLHGIIVADAFGIPAAWIHSPRVGGDGTKFNDHFLAVGGAVVDPLAWDDIADCRASQIIEMISARQVEFDSEAILGAFPHDVEE